jgi:hypothetical protein
MKKYILALAVLLLAGAVNAELSFKALSATATSQTYTFPSPRASVMICNLGADAIFFRLFNENDTAAAATTSYGTIAAGSATAPVCMSFAKAPTEAANWKWLSVVCDTAKTATVHVYSE